jgi:hypothetical protein
MADAFGVHETMICRCLLAANVLRHTKSDKSLDDSLLRCRKSIMA